MVTIIIISNEPHVLLLKERFQPLIKGQISIFSDFEQGLMAVFDKRPASVFIQREINGTTADVIARQIKGLLRDNSPRIILMGALTGNKQDGVQCFDDSFDFEVSEGELCTFFRAQLEKIPFLVWKEDQGVTEWSHVHDAHNPADELTQATASAPLDVTGPFGSQKLDNCDDHVNISSLQSTLQSTSDEAIHSTRENAAPVPRSDRAVDSSAVRESSASVSTEPRMKPSESTFRAEPASIKTAQQPVGVSVSAAGGTSRHPKPGAAADDFSSFGWGRQRETKHQRNWLFIAGIIATAVLAAAFFLTSQLSDIIEMIVGKPLSTGQSVRQPQRQNAAVGFPQHSTARQNRTLALPGIIPAQGKDPAYSAKHPGWERYVSKQAEFLVFSDGNKIKAIQVIATTGSGISEQTMTAFLKQAAGIDSYALSGTSNRNGYLIQQARLDGGAELAVYRTLSHKQIRGVVVTVQ